ncbi:unnamed protein product [Sphagnum jensenii]|uniref:Uncharacterized protein n=1 Tax=Sphagnum jensenii TaxID=128206 RepID=A0ABP0VFY0_9BRYO
MSAPHFYQRLLVKRPVVFMTGADHYMLANGISGYGGFDQLTEDEDDLLALPHLLSYEEMQISALASVAVPTYFVSSSSKPLCMRTWIQLLLVAQISMRTTLSLSYPYIPSF